MSTRPTVRNAHTGKAWGINQKTVGSYTPTLSLPQRLQLLQHIRRIVQRFVGRAPERTGKRIPYVFPQIVVHVFHAIFSLKEAQRLNTSLNLIGVYPILSADAQNVLDVKSL